MAFRSFLVGAIVWIAGAMLCNAGMPSPLPTGWTADNSGSETRFGDAGATADARWQALSFFAACLLLSAWGVKGLWNVLRRDLTWLPAIGYPRALSFVVLWGLLFVIVLTMISGARELMTPGAWKKQGWTYKLADGRPADDSAARDRAFEELRFALWNHAATHAGRFPSDTDPSIDHRLWEIPGWGGLRYLYVGGRSVEPAGRLLVFEPELDGRPRRVLLTNGLVGSMRTPEVERLLAGGDDP